jgi:hypothetical protein
MMNLVVPWFISAAKEHAFSLVTHQLRAYDSAKHRRFGSEPKPARPHLARFSASFVEREDGGFIYHIDSADEVHNVWEGHIMPVASIGPPMRSHAHVANSTSIRPGGKSLRRHRGGCKGRRSTTIAKQLTPSKQLADMDTGRPRHIGFDRPARWRPQRSAP